MIRRMGAMNFFIIFVLVVLIGTLFSYGAYILKPDLKRDDLQVRNNQNEIAQTSNNLENLQAGVDQFSKQRKEYEHLLKLGFFNPQNRLEIRNRLMALRDGAGALTLTYSGQPLEEQKNELAEEAGYKVLKTVMEINVGALEDRPIYDVIYFLNYGFPGHVEINSVSISREKEITQPLLRKIGDGDKEPLVTAIINVTWLTMVPAESIKGREVGAGR